MSIKKVTLNYGCGCWGFPTDLWSDCVSFTSNLVKYLRKPEMSCKTNPRIEYSYCPLENEFSMYREVILSSYEEDFVRLCFCAKSLIGRTQHEHICDAIAASLDIIFVDGRKINIPLGMECRDPAIDYIYKFADKYAPDFFKNKEDKEGDQ